MLANRLIICISSIDWDFNWQGHQEIMSSLAKQGNQVLFIDNTGIRAPNLRDMPRLSHRLKNWLRSTKGFRQEQENLVVFSPVILPFPYSRLARWANRALLLRAVRRWMRVMGLSRPVVWTFLPTPLARDLIERLDPELTVYYCVDDFSATSVQGARVLQSEAALFRAADLVFVTSEKLRERAAQYRDQVELVPIGVNVEKFAQVRQGPDGVPAELKSLPKPVIGYLGTIHQWFDLALVEAVAERLPQASLVFVGPPQVNVSRLQKKPNVHFLGSKPAGDVPGCVKGFDVGIIPYRECEFTAHVYPTKLNEYLAMGIPVVARETPAINKFNAQHGGVIATARDAESFCAAVLRVTQGSTDQDVRHRVAAAAANGWASRIERMSGLIEAQLAVPQARAPRWQDTLRTLYRQARQRALRVTAAAVLTWLLVFYTPLVWWLAAPLRLAEPPRTADAIVVFAGGVGESGQPAQGYEERVQQAVDLYRAGYAKSLVFSSGYVYRFAEPFVMRALAVQLGVPAEAIVLETEAKNTRENVVNTAGILARHGWDSILLVSSPYHMRRASLVWRKTAPGVQITRVPVAHSRFYARGADGPVRWWTPRATLRQVRAVAHEYAGIAYYALRGWL